MANSVGFPGKLERSRMRAVLSIQRLCGTQGRQGERGNFFGVGCDGHDIIRKKVSVQFLNRFQISWIGFKGETKETFGVGCLLSPCEGLRFISRVLFSSETPMKKHMAIIDIYYAFGYGSS